MTVSTHEGTPGLLMLANVSHQQQSWKKMEAEGLVEEEESKPQVERRMSKPIVDQVSETSVDVEADADGCQPRVEVKLHRV